jgi:hypothetical protein
MGLVLCVALAIAALRNADDYWAGGLMLGTALLIGVATVGALTRPRRARAGWLGFAVFGGGYFALAFLGLAHHNLERLPTTWILRYVHQRVASPQTYTFIVNGGATGQAGQGAILTADISPGPLPNTITTIATSQLRVASGVSADTSGRWKAMLPGAANYDAFSSVGHCLFAVMAGLLGIVIARWTRIRSSRPLPRPGYGHPLPVGGKRCAAEDSPPFAPPRPGEGQGEGGSAIGRGENFVLCVLVSLSGLASLARAGPPPPSKGLTRASRPITAPLQALASNPHYFTDGSGRAIYLTGSHTWNNFQDWGTKGAVRPLDFTAYVKLLVAHNHNFTLLWATELPVFRGLPSTASSPPDFTVSPQPWQRTGPGNASDGKLKFDLTKFNQAYFDRLRARVVQLHENGIYAGVYFFSGEFVLRFRFSGDGYPLTGSNNVNGIDDGGGTRSLAMTAPNAITEIQDAYVRKVIDTLNDLPNVLWIVSQEAPVGSRWWNSHLIALVRSYEAGKPLQHPIGYGALDGGKDDDAIINSDADWIAPSTRISPTATCGTGQPRCKVNINDSDHSYFGIWNDSPQVNRNYFWINFTNGNQTLFMDPYVVHYPREKRNLCPSPVNGISEEPDRRWDNVRATMGYIRGYADRMKLAAMTPSGKLASTGHVLASRNSGPSELLVYAPSGGTFNVDLSKISGRIQVEWMNPATGVKSAGAEVQGGAAMKFTPPFDGDAVLYLSANSESACVDLTSDSALVAAVLADRVDTGDSRGPQAEKNR